MAAIELSNCNGPSLGADAAQFLSEAYMDNGIIIRAPKGVSVQEPLTINHQAPPSGQIAFHKTLIILEEGASITIRENFNSHNQNDRSAICSSTNILASQNSQLNRILIQNLNTRSSFFQLDSSEANKSSRVKNCSLHLGSSQSRSESLAVISGEDAEIEILGLSIGTGEQLFDQRTRQLHIAPAGNSKLLYKNALLEESKAVFSGLIKVDEKAQGTNAYQTNRNLLLSPKAEADSLPELEILANEVKCSHGATTGEIDQEQLYYLRSRGIEKSAAEELLVFGFIEEVLESLKNEELVESLRTQVRQKFK
jgi:Fe-S cluster assembly protein SufD